VSVSLLGRARLGATRLGTLSAELYISLAGQQVGYGKATAAIMAEDLKIHEVLNETPNTATLRVKGIVPQFKDEIIVTLGSPHSYTRQFAGTVLSVDQSYEGTPANPEWDVHCIDYTWGLNSLKVVERFTSATVADIATALMAAYAPGGYTLQVGADIAGVVLDEITFTFQDLTDALKQLVTRAGGYFRCDYFRVVRLFITDTHLTAPLALTPSHPTLEDFHVSRDGSQAISRALFEGYGSAAAAAAAMGAAEIAVVDQSSFSSSGGIVVSGPQRITYGGLLSGGTTVSGRAVAAARPVPSAPTFTKQVNVLLPLSQSHTELTGCVKVAFLYPDNVASLPSLPSAVVTVGAADGWTIGSVAIGDAAVTGRRLWMSLDGGVTFTRYADINDNTTTTVVMDNLSDTPSVFLTFDGVPPTADLGYSPGTTYLYVDDASAFSGSGGSAHTGSQTVTYSGRTATSGFAALTGIPSTSTGSIGTAIAVGDAVEVVYPAGATSLPISDTSAFSSGGGTARTGSLTFTYTGRSTTSGAGNLTGIPPSGAGALTAAVFGTATVLVGAGGNGTLTGIPASGPGSIRFAINAGDPVNLLVKVDDLAAQAVLGIIEDYAQDRSVSEIEARARASARLAELNTVATEITYTVKDLNTKVGGTVPVALTSPTSVTGNFKLQLVDISDFEPNIVPKRRVTASSRRFAFEDLVKKFAQTYRQSSTGSAA
jgi:hypothetical protein